MFFIVRLGIPIVITFPVNTPSPILTLSAFPDADCNIILAVVLVVIFLIFTFSSYTPSCRFKTKSSVRGCH